MNRDDINKAGWRVVAETMHSIQGKRHVGNGLAYMIHYSKSTQFFTIYKLPAGSKDIIKIRAGFKPTMEDIKI